MLTTLYNRKVSWSVSSILPNKIERSVLLSHPLALASKLMSSLQHYTVQTLIPSPSYPKAHHLSTPLPALRSARSTLETSIKSYISERCDQE